MHWKILYLQYSYVCTHRETQACMGTHKHAHANDVCLLPLTTFHCACVLGFLVLPSMCTCAQSVLGRDEE